MEQRGKEKSETESSLEWSGTGEHCPPEVPWYNTEQNIQLQTAHAKHKDEGGNTQQPAEETSKLSVRDRCKNHKDNSTSPIAVLYSTGEYASSLV